MIGNEQKITKIFKLKKEYNFKGFKDLITSNNIKIIRLKSDNVTPEKLNSIIFVLCKITKMINRNPFILTNLEKFIFKIFRY